MKRIHSWLCPALAILIAFTVLVAPAFAANGERYAVSDPAAHNTAVAAKAEAVKQKYAIGLIYPTYILNGQEVAGIFPETLDTLDKALDNVSPYMVQLISQYYQQTLGHRLRIQYAYQDMAQSHGNVVEMTVGGFDDKTGIIYLMLPRPGEGGMITGDAPMTIVHELGHAVHVMLEGKYGIKLEGSWDGYNGNISYTEANIKKNPGETTFVSGYAATNFYEDFAETFAYGFICNQPGMGLYHRLVTTDNQLTPLGAKMRIMESTLSAYFSDAAQMLANFRKVYTTARSVSYGEVTLSGPHLQYMGYPEARYLSLYFLQELQDFSESRYRWVTELGGWVLSDNSGEVLVVFPDLAYQMLR